MGSSVFCTIVEKEYAVKDGQAVEVEKGKGEGNFFIQKTQKSWWSTSKQTLFGKSGKTTEETLWELTTTFENGSIVCTYFNYSSNDQQPPTISQTNKPLFQRFFDKCGLTFESCESEFVFEKGFKGWTFSYNDKILGYAPDEVIIVTFFENTGDKYTYVSQYLHRLAKNHTLQEIKDIKNGKVFYPYGSHYVKPDDDPLGYKTDPYILEEELYSPESQFVSEEKFSFWDKVKKTISSWF